MKTTKLQHLENMLTDIAMYNENFSACKDQAIERGQDKYLQIDYAACYGGYRVVNVGLSGGQHYGAFNLSSCVKRMNYAQMDHFLSGIIIGLLNNTKN